MQKYQTVADIDKPGVKVIANPGGSNERFAKANFKQAALTIHSDNIGIFDEVLKGNADVFVTESAEAIVQQRQNLGLCAVNPDKLAADRRDGLACSRRGVDDEGVHRPVAAPRQGERRVPARRRALAVGPGRAGR